MQERKYLKCSAKEKVNEWGSRILLGVKLDDLAAFAKAHVNERGYVNFVIAPRKEPGQYGDTHSVYLDEYMKSSGQNAPTTKHDQYRSPRRHSDDAPF